MNFIDWLIGRFVNNTPEAQDRAWAEWWQMENDNAADANMFERMQELMEEARLKSISTGARESCRPAQMTQEMWERLLTVPRGTVVAWNMPNVVGRVEPQARRPTCYDDLDDTDQLLLRRAYAQRGDDFRPDGVDFNPPPPTRETEHVRLGVSWEERDVLNSRVSYVKLGACTVSIAQSSSRTSGLVRELIRSALRPGGGAVADRAMQRLRATATAPVSLEDIALSLISVSSNARTVDEWIQRLSDAQVRMVSGGGLREESALPRLNAEEHEPEYSVSVTLPFEFVEENRLDQRQPARFREGFNGIWYYRNQQGDIRAASRSEANALEHVARMFGETGLEVIANVPGRSIYIQREMSSRCFVFTIESKQQAAIEHLRSLLAGQSRQHAEQEDPVIRHTIVVDSMEEAWESGAASVSRGPLTTYESMPVPGRASARAAVWLWQHRRDFVEEHRGFFVSVTLQVDNRIPEMSIIAIVRRREATGSSTKPQDAPQSTRRLKLSHKQRNDQNVSHQHDSSSKDSVNRGLARRRRRAE